MVYSGAYHSSTYVLQVFSIVWFFRLSYLALSVLGIVCGKITKCLEGVFWFSDCPCCNDVEPFLCMIAWVYPQEFDWWLFGLSPRLYWWLLGFPPRIYWWLLGFSPGLYWWFLGFPPIFSRWLLRFPPRSYWWLFGFPPRSYWWLLRFSARFYWWLLGFSQWVLRF